MLHSKACTDVMQRQHFSPAAALQIQKLQEMEKEEAAAFTPAPGEVLSNHEI